MTFVVVVLTTTIKFKSPFSQNVGLCGVIIKLIVSNIPPLAGYKMTKDHGVVVVVVAVEVTTTINHRIGQGRGRVNDLATNAAAAAVYVLFSARYS